MSTNQLPLRWTRIVSLSLLAGLSFTTSQLCMLMFELCVCLRFSSPSEKHSYYQLSCYYRQMKAQIAANQDAPAGVKIAIKYNGILSPSSQVVSLS
jgi:hypothetical protein